MFVTAFTGCKKSKQSAEILTPPTSTTAGTLVVPPSPGSLSTVEHVKQSGDYTVEVKKSGDTDYKPCFVYKTDNYFSGRNPFGIGGRSQTAASFTNFSFSGTSIDVRITSSFAANSVIIRPLSDGVNFQRTGNVITFSLSEPKKLSIEVNGRTNPLFIFADAPDVPNTAATYYYGPGVHNIGKNKVITSGQSVYIAGGAVVEGSFNIAFSAQNVSIKGRGILSNGEWEFPTSLGYTDMQSASTIRNLSSNNTLIEGIMIANSTGWTLQMESYDNTITNAQYKNLKIINWNISSDAIWIDGLNTVVDDCFIFNNDDMLTTHGSTNCRVSNMVLWGGTYGNMFMQASFKSSNGITYDDIDVIGKEDSHGAQLIEIRDGGTSNISINNITFKNIRVENRRNTNSKFLGIKSKTQTLNNWLFENISIDGANPDEGDIHGTTNGLISGFTFRNLKINGVKASSLGDARMDINSFVSDVKFE